MCVDDDGILFALVLLRMVSSLLVVLVPLLVYILLAVGLLV